MRATLLPENDDAIGGYSELSISTVTDDAQSEGAAWGLGLVVKQIPEGSITLRLRSGQEDAPTKAKRARFIVLPEWVESVLHVKERTGQIDAEELL